jgi:GT2 family glycosyltransferase
MELVSIVAGVLAWHQASHSIGHFDSRLVFAIHALGWSWVRTLILQGRVLLHGSDLALLYHTNCLHTSVWGLFRFNRRLT